VVGALLVGLPDVVLGALGVVVGGGAGWGWGLGLGLGLLDPPVPVGVGLAGFGGAIGGGAVGVAPGGNGAGGACGPGLGEPVGVGVVVVWSIPGVGGNPLSILSCSSVVPSTRSKRNAKLLIFRYQ
jgi:hypothetical protein